MVRRRGPTHVLPRRADFHRKAPRERLPDRDSGRFGSATRWPGCSQRWCADTHVGFDLSRTLCRPTRAMGLDLSGGPNDGRVRRCLSLPIDRRALWRGSTELSPGAADT